MGCRTRALSGLFSPKVVDWGIKDPKGKPREKVREIRDEIEKRVMELLKEIETGNVS